MRGRGRRTEPFDLAVAITVVAVLGVMGGYMAVAHGPSFESIALFMMAGGFALWAVLHRRV